MTYREAQIRIKQTKTPEHIVKSEKHDPETCLAYAWDPFPNGSPRPTCRCGGAKRYGYNYSVVLGEK